MGILTWENPQQLVFTCESNSKEMLQLNVILSALIHPLNLILILERLSNKCITCKNCKGVLGRGAVRKILKDMPHCQLRHFMYCPTADCRSYFSSSSVVRPGGLVKETTLEVVK